uniref:Uncharacterized protein n=1 Tax=Cyanoderma ruficeps TaxID=181631 RepID=A0A8C3RGE8_9PASS
MVFLQEWDSAHKVAQSCVLNSFIESKAEPELELEFQGASLFLAHLTVWLRMIQVTFLASFPLFLQPCSHRYLTEFLEIRGAWIPLEILGLNHLKEEDKRESVKLLLLTGDTGREYKKPIRESCGTQVQILTKFLNASNSAAEGQKDAQVLLDSGPQQCQVPEPRFPRPRSRAVVYLWQAQHGSLQTLGVTQVRRGPCWGKRAVLPSVSIRTQAGTVPESLALWLYCLALLPGREQPGELCEDCP